MSVRGMCQAQIHKCTIATTNKHDSFSYLLHSLLTWHQMQWASQPLGDGREKMFGGVAALQFAAVPAEKVARVLPSIISLQKHKYLCNGSFHHFYRSESVESEFALPLFAVVLLLLFLLSLALPFVWQLAKTFLCNKSKTESSLSVSIMCSQNRLIHKPLTPRKTKTN